MASSSKVTRTHRCIWCTVIKPEPEFNIEHVMLRAFGTFEQNLTLINAVCTACNGFFSRELEPWLARDSLEGFDRYRYGHKPPSAFKSQGNRSTTRVQLTDGPYAGAWGVHTSGQENLGIRLFPQVGFSQSPDGPFEWYPLDQLPVVSELKDKGYSGNGHIRLCECDRGEAAARFAERGINVDFLDSFVAPSGGMWVDQVFRLTLMHRRGLAKIALNYVAYQYGAAVALEERFDVVRALVMHGVEPPYRYYDIDELPIIRGDKANGRRYLGHAIRIAQRGHHVRAVVSLYNRFRHGFLLACESGSVLKPCGHFFDIGNRIIHPLAPSAG